MDLEKIYDFIDAYSKALQIDDEYKAILKELIPKLVEKYSKIYTKIPVEQDNDNKYIIKPVDGKYSIEAQRCVGACGLAPVFTVNGKVYGKATVKMLDQVLDELDAQN